MTNRRPLWKFSLLSLLALPIMIACSSDENDEKGVNDNPAREKRITKIVEERSGSISETNIKYDTQGRIIEAITTSNSSKSKNDKLIKTFQYGEMLIIEREEAEGDWANDPTVQYPRTHTYTLSNGLIVKDVETRNGNSSNISYHYDSEGYMNSYTPRYDVNFIDSDYPDVRKIYLKWSDGNLKCIEYLGLDLNYTYSNLQWTKKIIFNLLIENTDIYLFSQGYYGKLPKLLPSSIDATYFYDYTTSSGIVTRIATKIKDNSVGESNVITNFTWE